ncbi:MAG TPA: hypothetical protein VIK28_06985 [Sedimentisphaerales bacterium]
MVNITDRFQAKAIVSSGWRPVALGSNPEKLNASTCFLGYLPKVDIQGVQWWAAMPCLGITVTVHRLELQDLSS